MRVLGCHRLSVDTVLPALPRPYPARLTGSDLDGPRRTRMHEPEDPLMPIAAYYMGSYGRGPGMRLYGSGMADAGAGPPRWPFGDGGVLDSTYAPVKPGVRRDEEPQGRARITLVGGWTVLAFWDRTGPDKRGAINSTFVIEGTHSPHEALALATEYFPQVFERLHFEVSLEGFGWFSGRTH